MSALQAIESLIQAERQKEEADLKDLSKIVSLIKNLDQKVDEKLGALTSDDQYKLLDMKEVCQLTSFSKSFIESQIREESFPTPKKFGSANRWYKKDIERWIRENMENN